MRISEPVRGLGTSEPVLVTAEVEAGSLLASWPLAMPVFFLCWMGLGILLAAAAHTTPHLRRSMLAVGAGLGPITALLTLAARRRRRASQPMEIARGRGHGGHLDVLVVIEDCMADVAPLSPTLSAIAGDIGTVTLALPLPDLWLDEHPAEAVDAARSILLDASASVPIADPALVVYPDTTVADVAARFSGHGRVVLFASDHAPWC